MESIFPASDKSGMGHSDSPSGIKERQMLGFGKFFFPFPWDKQTKKKNLPFIFLLWVGLLEEVMFGSVVNILPSF